MVKSGRLVQLQKLSLSNSTNRRWSQDMAFGILSKLQINSVSNLNYQHNIRRSSILLWHVCWKPGQQKKRQLLGKGSLNKT
jgi:hypothetical protein